MTDTEPNRTPGVSSTQTDDDIRLTVSAQGGVPLPLSLAAYLLRAIGAAYPSACVTTARLGSTLSMRIPRSDVVRRTDTQVTDHDLAEIAPVPTDPDTVSFLEDFPDLTGVGVRIPSWLSAWLSHTALELASRLPDEAVNYLSIRLGDPDEPDNSFTWIITRPGQPSPSDLHQAALARIEQLEQQLRDSNTL